MLIDLLNSYNYLMVNMDAIKIFGLNSAVYCSELLNIYKKARMKKRLIEDKYFEVDRKFISEQTSLTEEEQLVCDLNLMKVNIISLYREDNPNIINFNFDLYASLIASEDMKEIEKISKAVKVVSPRGTKAMKKIAVLENLKKTINSGNDELDTALKDWLEAVYTKHGWASKKNIDAFIDALYDYTKGDVSKALEIVKIATLNGWVDCSWAVKSYESKNRPNPNGPRVTEQRVASEDDLDGEGF